MTTTQRPRPASNLVLTAVLSGSITCVLSLIYVILCIVALVYRFDCDAAASGTIRGSSHLMTTVYRVYFQGDCPNALTLSDITTDYSVLVLVSITLAASTVCLVAAIVLITVYKSETATEYIAILTYTYIGICVASFIVDLTFAIHFGMDYSHVSGLLNSFTAGLSFNYELDMIRIGAFLLMTVVLKGFVSHAIGLVLLILLGIYVRQYSKSLEEYEHSIHKLGVLKAYDSKTQRESIAPSRCENCQSNAVMAFNGGSHMNYGYLSDDEPAPRSLTRENSRRERDDYSMPSYDRSHSWQQGPSSRPFSYLEDSKRQAPRPPPSPSEPQWRRQPWQSGPPVPAPDYSPHAPRRLKSALKPAYM